MCCPVLVPHSRGRGPAPEWAVNWAVRHWVRAVARESADTRELGPDTENISKLSRNWQMSGELRHICKVSASYLSISTIYCLVTLKEQGEESVLVAPEKYVLLTRDTPPHAPLKVQHTPKPVAQAPPPAPPSREHSVAV